MDLKNPEASFYSVQKTNKTDPQIVKEWAVKNHHIYLFTFQSIQIRYFKAQSQQYKKN